MTAQCAGLYVHVPFCLTRCGYCDFNTYAGLDHLKRAYAEALIDEAQLWSRSWSDVDFASVFLGGGTPTTLPAPTLNRLLERFRTLFRLATEAEVTSEANPDTVDTPYLGALLAAGITRLSLGVQSFDPAVLASLERLHSPESARRAFRSARAAGFGNINMDIIYGAAGESLESWRRTLEETLDLAPDHVSCYALTIEPNTPLGRKVAAGLVPPPDPDLQTDMYETACELLARAGYEHYEVSNWSLPGHECVHNMGYWEGRPYLGLGAGAHSHRDDRRWWNVRPPAQYLSMVERGDLPVGDEERLTTENRRLERLLLGLRTSRGVPSEWIDAGQALGFVGAGLLESRNGRFSPTDRGMLLANELVVGLAT